MAKNAPLRRVAAKAAEPRKTAPKCGPARLQSPLSSHAAIQIANADGDVKKVGENTKALCDRVVSARFYTPGCEFVRTQ